MLRQLWGEAQTAGPGIRITTTPAQDAAPGQPRTAQTDGDVFIIQEKPSAER